MYRRRLLSDEADVVVVFESPTLRIPSKLTN